MPRTQSFHAGITAFEAGLSIKANPHPFNTRAHIEWNNGYRNAHDEFVYDDLTDNLGAENEYLGYLGISPRQISE